MNIYNSFSLRRYYAIVIKEFTHMLRDKFTIALVVGIPIMQLILFGYAINMNPHALPTVLINQDNTPQVRQLITAMQNTNYFDIRYTNIPLKDADKLMQESKAVFIINIPAGFTKTMLRGEKPQILVTADGSDPNASGSALSALSALVSNVYARDFMRNGLSYLQSSPPAFEFVTHNKYNPEQKTTNNIVPGLAGVILTMVMVMTTGLAITREREVGTMESLLATPVRPVEVILGKITPYILVGYTQLLLILTFASILFGITIQGSIPILILVTLPFIVANLLVGITFSTIARTQLQAMQMTMFFFLPSILLSGFMFPFYGMPTWAQWIGEALPITHYLRIIRGIVLKGSELMTIWSSLWPILIFIIVIGIICVKRYRETL